MLRNNRAPILISCKMQPLVFTCRFRGKHRPTFIAKCLTPPAEMVMQLSVFPPSLLTEENDLLGGIIVQQAKYTRLSATAHLPRSAPPEETTTAGESSGCRYSPLRET